MFVCTNEQLPSRANKTIDIHTDTNAHTPPAHTNIQSIYTAHIYSYACKHMGRDAGRGAARMTTFGFSFIFCSCFCCSAGGVVEYTTAVVAGVVVVLFGTGACFCASVCPCVRVCAALACVCVCVFSAAMLDLTLLFNILGFFQTKDDFQRHLALFLFLGGTYIHIFPSQSAGCCFVSPPFWSLDHNKQKTELPINERSFSLRNNQGKSENFAWGFFNWRKKTEQKERRRRRHKRRANEQAGKANWKCVRRKKQKQSCNEQQGARRVARLIGYRLPAIDSEPPKGANC